MSVPPPPPQQQQQQRVVLVTGSSPNGLGYEICTEFRKQNYRVFATARDVKTLKTLEDHGCDTLPLDVTNSESITAAAKELSLRTGGRLDVLVNNAAIVTVVPAITEDPASVSSVISTNLIGPILVGQAFIPLIIFSNKGKGGVIINVSSIAGVTPMPWHGTYSAAKAGLRSMSSTWRMELKNFGIHVIDVVAGGMATNMSDVVFKAPAVEPSAPYWNWLEIDAKRRTTADVAKSAHPASVARDIVAAAVRNYPPLDLYTGTGAWMFRFIPYLPTSWVELLFGGPCGTKLVSYRP